MQKILVILGPTATGKTDLALQLADKYNGELVACDSRQVYRGLDIGTGKMPGKTELTFTKHSGYWVIKGVNIWLYDLVSPETRYDVSEYVKDAGKVIGDIKARGKLPIIVGGTGLYLKALLHGLPNLSKPVDPDLREELEKLSLEELQKKLSTLSPAIFENLNNSEKNNPRRLVRQIELQLSLSDTNNKEQTTYNIQNFNLLKIGLTAPRVLLNEKIDQRVLQWISDGIIEEVDKLHESGLSYNRLRELGLEYRYLADYLEGIISSKEELITILKTKTHQYAKRQMTWFKKESGVSWFNIQDGNMAYKVEKLVQEWYNG